MSKRKMETQGPTPTVKIVSTRFGELEVPESSVVTIVGGLIGFSGLERFVLLDYNPPFSWLHSVDNGGLAFVVVSAAEFGEDYKVPPPFSDPMLELKPDDDIAILNIVTVRPDAVDTTVNLKAPVVVNLRNMRGRQVVLDSFAYPTRLPLVVKKEDPATP